MGPGDGLGEDAGVNSNAKALHTSTGASPASPSLPQGPEGSEGRSFPSAASSRTTTPAIAIDPLPMCQFTVPYKAVKQGESLILCGDIPEMGGWDPTKGLKLNWLPGDSWVGKIRLPAGATFDAKVR